MKMITSGCELFLPRVAGRPALALAPPRSASVGPVTHGVCGWTWAFFILRTFVFSVPAFVVLLAPPVLAIEPAQEFLEGLKERRYFDTAIDYLDEVKDSPLVSADFKMVIPYEKGQILILASRTSRDMQLRESQLNQAQQLLKDFVEARQSHSYAALANSQLANLLVERAKISIERSNGANVADEQKQNLVLEARKNYDQAIGVLQSTLDDLKERLSRFGTLDKNKPSDVRLIEIRDRYRTDFLQGRLLVPAIREEQADTYPEGSKQRKTLLTEAANEFKDVHEDYRTRIAGLYAQLYEGRCYAKLDKAKDALFCFESLLEQPDAREFRELKLKTLVLAAPLWLDSDPPRLDDAINKIDTLLQTANPEEEQEPEWLFLAYAYGRASKMKADELEQKSRRSREETTEMVRNRRVAKGKLTFVARYPGEYRQAARDLLKTMPDVDLPEEEHDAPLNLAQARTKGKEALSDMLTASKTLQNLQAELGQATDAARKQEVQRGMQETQKEVQARLDEAHRMFRLALELGQHEFGQATEPADQQRLADDMNVVRYYQCYLYYYVGDYYDAAAVGEFVAMRHPQATVARQCAQIALASYINARKSAISDDRAAVQFESEKITEICLFITRQWRDQPEAAEAARTLIVFRLQEKDFDKAVEYLDLFPEESAKRGESERLIGQYIWAVYRKEIDDLMKSGAEAAEIDDKKARSASDISRAAQLLESGLGGVGKQPVDEATAAASLALAQVYVEQGASDKAVKLVEDEKFGPLALIKQEHPAAEKRYAQEAYETALRAYLGTLSSSDRLVRDSANKNSEKIIGDLQTLLSGTPEDKERLVNILIGMANDLKDQMDAVEGIGPKKAFAEGLANFLEKLSVIGGELKIRIWSANSFYTLGEMLASSDPLAASDYYEKSVDAFTKVLQEPGLAAGTRTQIEMLMAEMKLRLKDYPGALEEFAKILREQNSLISVQFTAAKAYQDWGDDLLRSDKKAADDKFAKSMVGGVPDERQTIDGAPNKSYKSNVIWGSGKLASIAARTISKYPQFRETFFDARYNLAYSRWKLAEIRNSEKYRTMAKSDILKTTDWTKWQPGNEEDVERMKNFDTLLRDIERSLGVANPQGLPISAEARAAAAELASQPAG